MQFRDELIGVEPIGNALPLVYITDSVAALKFFSGTDPIEPHYLPELEKGLVLFSYGKVANRGPSRSQPLLEDAAVQPVILVLDYNILPQHDRVIFPFDSGLYDRYAGPILRGTPMDAFQLQNVDDVRRVVCGFWDTAADYFRFSYKSALSKNPSGRGRNRHCKSYDSLLRGNRISKADLLSIQDRRGTIEVGIPVEIPFDRSALIGGVIPVELLDEDIVKEMVPSVSFKTYAWDGSQEAVALLDGLAIDLFEILEKQGCFYSRLSAR